MNRLGGADEPTLSRTREAARSRELAAQGHLDPHELRHSAVSLLSAAGVRLEDVADVMGHRSTRTTSAVYRHVVVPTIRTG
jgi:integrase